MRAPCHFRQRTKIGVVINKDGAVERFLQAMKDVDAHPFGEDGALGNRTCAAVYGPRNAGTCSHHCSAVYAIFTQ